MKKLQKLLKRGTAEISSSSGVSNVRPANGFNAAREMISQRKLIK